MANKGSPFEGEVSVCRSSGSFSVPSGPGPCGGDSGARAKTRGRAGKATFGAHGDICAVDPIGLPLTDCCTLELKRGYKKWSFLDILDRPRMKSNQKNKTIQPFEIFMEQVQEDADLVGNWPVIIAKRDKRCKVIAIPEPLYDLIAASFGQYNEYKIKIDSNSSIRYPMVVIDFEFFLEWCPPKFFTDGFIGYSYGKGSSDEKKKRFRHSK